MYLFCGKAKQCKYLRALGNTVPPYKPGSCSESSCPEWDSFSMNLATYVLVLCFTKSLTETDSNTIFISISEERKKCPGKNNHYKYQPTYWDFPLCTMIFCLLPGYQKKWGLHNHTVPVGFICFLLPSKSFHLFTDFKPHTIRGSTFKRHWSVSYRKRLKPLLDLPESLQWEFKLYLVCKGATVWHKPVTRKGDRNVLKALQQLTWRDGECCEPLLP